MDFLNHPDTERIIRAALEEDIRDGDHTTLSTIPEGHIRKARCLIKDEGILAGVAVAEKAFMLFDPTIKFTKELEDGSRVKHSDIAFYVEGEARTLLTVERLVLNIMQRMSGIATYTRSLVDLLEGLECELLDTRKTTPLFRHFEKWAVKIGGGTNHRMGLYDMMMIKDNHVDFAGGIRQAVEAALSYQQEHGLKLPIEVETRSLDEVRQVMEVGKVDRIMLDNMSPELMKEAVELIGGKYETEASGGITETNIRAKAEAGVDFISIGALTHSVRSLDISLKAVNAG